MFLLYYFIFLQPLSLLSPLTMVSRQSLNIIRAHNNTKCFRKSFAIKLVKLLSCRKLFNHNNALHLLSSLYFFKKFSHILNSSYYASQGCTTGGREDNVTWNVGKLNLSKLNDLLDSNLWLGAKLDDFLPKTTYTLLTNLSPTVTEEIPVGTCVDCCHAPALDSIISLGYLLLLSWSFDNNSRMFGLKACNCPEMQTEVRVRRVRRGNGLNL